MTRAIADRMVSIFGDKWSIHLLGTLAFGEGPLRFNQLMEALKPISSRTLSAELVKLAEHGIVKKEIEHASPPFSKYSLTEKGMELVPVLKAMAEWHQKWYGKTQ